MFKKNDKNVKLQGGGGGSSESESSAIEGFVLCTIGIPSGPNTILIFYDLYIF